MKTQNIYEYIAQLLKQEAGVTVEKPHYGSLREVFESLRDRGFRPDAQTIHGTEPSLFGLSLTQARRMWREYYGMRDADKMGADALRRIGFDDWLIGIQRAAWLPLCCEKMPYQALSNTVAECCRRTDDPVAVLHQLMDILEELRRLFSPTMQPLEPAAQINTLITRHIYCLVKSKPVCEEVVKRMGSEE